VAIDNIAMRILLSAEMLSMRMDGLKWPTVTDAVYSRDDWVYLQRLQAKGMTISLKCCLNALNMKD